MPFETNIDDTHERQVERYLRLVSDIEETGNSVTYFPVEIGSRGYISPDNFTTKRLAKDPYKNPSPKT